MTTTAPTIVLIPEWSQTYDQTSEPVEIWTHFEMNKENLEESVLLVGRYLVRQGNFIAEAKEDKSC